MNDEIKHLSLTIVTTSLAAIATISAQETVLGHAASNLALASSMT